jgi:hypothetical protein
MIFKRLTVALAALFALAGSAFASGTIPFSLSQQFDQFGHPLAGCQFYTIQAGTTSTPQNAFQDSALTIPLPNPQTCDAAGRLPQMFFADGTIKVRLTDKNGVTQVIADNIQVIGASSGGGGGGTVDPTTILQTGDFKEVYGSGVITGFVRCNGRTIGSATSGATERANLDTESLFEDLWNADPNLPVSTGRGISANADWVANKQLTLPDCRGRVLAGLDDMGNTAAGRLTASYWGSTGGCSSVAGTLLGAACGSENQILTASQLPTINVSTSGEVSVFPGGSSNNFSPYAAGVGNTNNLSTGSLSPGSNFIPINQGASFAFTATYSGNNTLTGSSTNTGGNAHPDMPPTILVTTYIKL